METLLLVLCVVVFLLAIVAFSPVVIVVDSRNRQIRIRWLLALEFQMPVPGATGQKFFSIFRKRFPIPEQQPAAQAAGVKKEKPLEPAMAVHKRRRKRRAMGQFFIRCLGDSDIRRALARQISLLIRRVFRSTDLTRAEGDISLPDPALNGMLAGSLAACNGGRGSGIRANFTGENRLYLEFRFHPHLVFKAFLLSLPGLPYRAVFKQWRTFSAARPH